MWRKYNDGTIVIGRRIPILELSAFWFRNDSVIAQGYSAADQSLDLYQVMIRIPSLSIPFASTAVTRMISWSPGFRSVGA